jgi:16S rRNA (adenine1518-N6/adenine1519-N6)-dimethyltransferase
LPPRKRFGQNFLHQARIIERIIAAVAPQPTDSLLEIGPGQGSLTLPLLRTTGHLAAVELDRDLLAPLQQLCAPHGTLTLYQADAARFNLSQLDITPPAGGLRIVGNLPYNAATAIIFNLLAQAVWVRDMHFMVQKEVARRLVATVGAEYGRLSVMVQAVAQVELLFNVAPGAFFPPPKVDSSVVRITPLKTPWVSPTEMPLFSRLVAAAFAQRRKTLRNALAGCAPATALAAADIDPGLRAEQVPLAAYVALTRSTALLLE